MQEEVNQKTVALSIRTTKLTGKVLAAALGKVVRALQKHHQKALTPQGRQSVKKLMNHYGGKSAMPYVGAPKEFDRIAKEFHVDYASGNSSTPLFCKPMRQSWNRWRSAALWGVRPSATSSKPEKRLPNRQRQSGLRRKSPAAVQSVDLGPCWPEAERRREP